MNGFINFYKVPGIASNKALDTIKRASGEKKAGFLGTLDPIAAGILPVGLGWATRLFPYFETLPKTYQTTLVLGSETDTQDSTGAATREASFAHVTKELIEAALEKFRGEIDQVSNHTRSRNVLSPGRVARPLSTTNTLPQSTPSVAIVM